MRLQPRYESFDVATSRVSSCNGWSIYAAYLRRQRHPVCPANGILRLLPFEMLKASDQDVAELERAVAADLATIYRELQLRCPVTAVVVGMDQEQGFRELIRRIGRRRRRQATFRPTIRSSHAGDGRRAQEVYEPRLWHFRGLGLHAVSR